MALEIVILAAGMGKRMHSNIPKVLHSIANKPMLMHVIDTASTLKASAIHLVLGHQKEEVKTAVENYIAHDENLSKIKVLFHEQKEQLGTAHALLCAMPHIDNKSEVLVLYGDTPLTPSDELQRLLNALNQDNELAILTSCPANPFGYGRIVRDENGVLVRIVEEKDADEKIKLIQEVNSGMLASYAYILNELLNKIDNHNAQGEYYLTDLTELYIKHKNKNVLGIKAHHAELLEGVNNKVQLSKLERIYQENKAYQYMQQGLTLLDPKRFDVRGSLSFGQNCQIDINVIIEGKVELGDNVIIGAGCILKDVCIKNNSIISPYTIMEKSVLHERTTIGPFARLRPGNELEADVHIGNFVEVKNSHIKEGTKAGHLSYLGDSTIGQMTNIGAGTITCNYDGANKHRTIIGKNVFVGSDTQLVAPVTVEDGATIGAGTTVTSRVPANSLIITRPQARIIDGYIRPSKKKA